MHILRYYNYAPHLFWLNQFKILISNLQLLMSNIIYYFIYDYKLLKIILNNLYENGLYQ